MTSPLSSRFMWTLAFATAILSTHESAATTPAPLRTKATSVIPEIPQISTPWDVNPVITQGREWTGNLTWAWEGTAATVFTCTGLPPGLQLDSATGQITGTPTRAGIYTITARAASGGTRSDTATRRIAVSPPGVPEPGIYECILGSSSARPLSGLISINVSVSGSYSGIMRLGTRNVPLAGVFRTLQGPSEASATSQFNFTDPEGATVKARFYSSGGSVPFLEYTGPQTQTYAGSVDMSFILPALGNTPDCPLAGRHVIGMTPGLKFIDPRSVKVGPGSYGSGFGTATIGADYRLNFVGQSPEGRGLTGSCWTYPASRRTQQAQDGVPLDQLGCYFYIADNATTAIWGDVGFPATNFDSSFLSWARLPASGRLYPEGISGARLQLLSSRMTPQALAAGFPSREYSLYLQAEEEFSARNTFLLTRSYRAVFTSNPESNLSGLRLDLHAPTGFFTGKFTLRGSQSIGNTLDVPEDITRTAQYRGMFLPEIGIGVGHFLIPALPNPAGQPPTTLRTSPILSGNVLIERALIRD